MWVPPVPSEAVPLNWTQLNWTQQDGMQLDALLPPDLPRLPFSNYRTEWEQSTAQEYRARVGGHRQCRVTEWKPERVERAEPALLFSWRDRAALFRTSRRNDVPQYSGGCKIHKGCAVEPSLDP
jgi:hypothetical protein